LASLHDCFSASVATHRGDLAGNRSGARKQIEASNPEKQETSQTAKGDRSMKKSTKPADKKSGKIGEIAPEVFESTLIDKVIN
jgi:hypothetical protein